jgi:hypothetical protein
MIALLSLIDGFFVLIEVLFDLLKLAFNLVGVAIIIVIIVIFLRLIKFIRSKFRNNSGIDIENHILFKDPPKNVRKSISSGNTYSNARPKKAPFKPSNYDVIHRNDEADNNMNYNLYTIKGMHYSTQRMRTIRNAEAFSESDARKIAKEKGLMEPYDIEKVAFPAPSEAQISYLRDIYGSVPSDACLYDVSALLTRVIDKDSIPNPGLIEYATIKKVKLSRYIGKRTLYDLLWDELDSANKIAFFIFCVYRFVSDDRTANLQESTHRVAFYNFAYENERDERFLKSMNKYEGSDLRYFGTIEINGWEHVGGSKGTIAYKRALEYLKLKGIV